MRKRAMLLITALGIAVIAVACGKATEREINQALGITPTPTQSAEEIATATARAAAQTSGSPAAFAQGDITQGSTFYRINCSQCHRPDGTGRGPALTVPGSPLPTMSVDQLGAFLRGEPAPSGTVHSRPPYTTAELSDKTIIDIYAFLQSEIGQ